MKPLFKSIACYLFLCCFIVGKLYAQTEIDTTFAHAMTTTFGNIDRSKVPYGILRDFGMEFTNLENYDGIATLADSNLVDEQSF